MLHRASCRTIRVPSRSGSKKPFTGEAYIKVCAVDVGELLTWVRGKGGTDFTAGCELCRPLPGRAATAPKRARRYWALRALPRKYRVLDAVRDLAVDVWRSSRSRLAAGDRAVIWQGKDDVGRCGVVALGEILAPPSPMSDPSNPYWLDESSRDEIAQRVPVRYVRIPSPLWLGAGKDILLQGLNIANRTGGGVATVSPGEWDAIVARVGGWPADHAVADVVERALRDPSHRSTGQGFGLTSKERRAVELHAMSVAKAHYAETWGEVCDVSDRASFDLLCRSADGCEMHVEVKGTTSDGSVVLLTRNEVQHARERFPSTALFVVTNIELGTGPDGEPVASGGQTRAIEPWDVDRCILTPLAFRCELPRV